MEGRLELDLNWEQDLDNCWCCSQTLVVLEPAGHKSQHVLKQVPLLLVLFLLLLVVLPLTAWQWEMQCTTILSNMLSSTA